MFQDASKRSFDVLLFWSLDRLSRQGVLETLTHLQRLTSYGVGYRSFTEQYLDSCGIFKDAVIGILAVVAKQERVRISERTIAGLATARAKGKVLGRPRVILDVAQVKLLRGAGASITAIAKQLGVSVGTVHSVCKSCGI
jgi:DNA invertase Pin-like site-specific DNA recombinase